MCVCVCVCVCVCTLVEVSECVLPHALGNGDGCTQCHNIPGEGEGGHKTQNITIISQFTIPQ